MIEYNKYCKELGLTKKDFPFNELSKRETIEEKMSVMTWNLDKTLLIEMYCYFRALRDQKIGFPICLEKEGGSEKWNEILDTILEGIKAKYQSDFWGDWDDKKKYARADRKFKKSMKLMYEWWDAFWW